MPYRITTLLALSLLIAVPSLAKAHVVVSSQTTQNMICDAGVCSPTSTDAILNVSDLEGLLASGDVTVTTTGDGVQANGFIIRSPLSWGSQTTLTLAAKNVIKVQQDVDVSGGGGITFSARSPDAIIFTGKGQVTFAEPSSRLKIQGTTYTLVASIAQLAAQVASNPRGFYALAGDYDAKADGVYGDSPISKKFSGVFEGLGNRIIHLAINNGGGHDIGLFAQIQGAVRNVGVVNANVKSDAEYAFVGILAGFATGHVSGAYSSGKVKAGEGADVGGLIGYFESVHKYGHHVPRLVRSHSSATVSVAKQGEAGGLVGSASGIIMNSYATGSVSGGADSYAGGLVGVNGGEIERSFATGATTTGGAIQVAPPPSAGGLIGYNFGADAIGPVANCYATGSVTAGRNANAGGLIGYSFDVTLVEYSYSTGMVEGGGGAYVGGLVGYDDCYNDMCNVYTDTYWDTDTSGVGSLSQGAGNYPNDPGITGLTTAQLQSGLPEGFDPGIWGETDNINGGLPYLLSNRLQK